MNEKAILELLRDSLIDWSLKTRNKELFENLSSQNWEEYVVFPRLDEDKQLDEKPISLISSFDEKKLKMLKMEPEERKRKIAICDTVLSCRAFIIDYLHRNKDLLSIEVKETLELFTNDMDLLYKTTIARELSYTNCALMFYSDKIFLVSSGKETLAQALEHFRKNAETVFLAFRDGRWGDYQRLTFD